ncbi:UNVERIFIED_CONTAM: inner nuclear membrane protein enriched at telomere/subtelomere region [Siphonaria sp. JEL0065]|nr:inner nuclear membrane protein enriched at telomere/subtelomere region [Siphonaria sp. JEL0065]
MLTASPMKKTKLRVPPNIDDSFTANDATIDQLVSILSSAGVAVPMARMKKQFYMDLFEQHITPLLASKDTKNKRGSTPLPASSGSNSSSVVNTPAKQLQQQNQQSPTAKSVRSSFIDFEALATPKKALPNFAETAPLFVQSPKPDSPSNTDILDEFEGDFDSDEQEEDDHGVEEDESSDEEVLTWDTLEPALHPNQNAHPSAIKHKPFTATPARPTEPPFTAVPKNHLPSNPSTKQQPSSCPISPAFTISASFVFLLVSYFGAYAIFWDRVSYLNSGETPSSFDLIGVPILDRVFWDGLVPLERTCPNGATCAGKMINGCTTPDYTIKKTLVANMLDPYLVQGWELAVWRRVSDVKCVKDFAKVKVEAKKTSQVDNLVAYLNDIVRKWAGHMLCGESNFDPEITSQELQISYSSKSREPLGMPVTAGKRQLRSLIGSKWTDEKFEEYWTLVYHRVLTGSESDSQQQQQQRSANLTPLLTTTVDESGRHRLLVSSSAPTLSITCHIRLSLRQQARKYWLQIITTSLLLLLSAAYYFHKAAQRRDSLVASTLVEDILECLFAESENHRVDPLRHPVPGLSVAMVRDHFISVCNDTNTTTAGLQKKTNQQLDAYGYAPMLDSQGHTRWTVADDYTRDKIWKRVCTLVLKNANVRETVMELGGEENCVWQWIGSFALSPKKRKMVGSAGVGFVDGGSGRKSFGGGSGRKSIVPGAILFDSKSNTPLVRKSKLFTGTEELGLGEDEESVKVKEEPQSATKGFSSVRQSDVSYPTL